MALAHGTKIVRDGLILHLDAANPKSYPGTGTAWFDLSGNRYHMSLKNSPTFNSTDKVFELDGVDDYGSCDGTVPNSEPATVENLGIGDDSPKTVVVVCQVREIGGTQQGFFNLGDHGSDGRHFCLRLLKNYTTFRAQFWNDPDYDFNYDGRNKFTFFSVVYGTDKIGRTFGNNAQLLGQDDSPKNLVTAGSRPFEMGIYPLRQNDRSGIRVSQYMVYNKGLSVEEIQQNYNAMKGRYGL